MSTRTFLFASALVVLAAGCSSSVTSAVEVGGPNPNAGLPGNGGAGATPGGAQDIGLFRQKIEQGVVPDSTDLSVEGLLSEHDLPIEGPPCTEALCVASALSIAKNADGKTAAFVQVGFSSAIDAQTFRRDPLTMTAVVDRSGSMAGGKILAARTALHKLVDQLGEADRLGLVIFDHEMEVLTEPVPVVDRSFFHTKIDTIYANGSTDIELGLRKGFELTAAAPVTMGGSKRVMLFTDALPNTGATATSEFVTLTNQYAEQGVGLTAFGVGIDFGAELVHHITHARGGSYFFLEDDQKLAKVFDEDFDFLVTPIAYDLHLGITPKTAWKVTAAYGVPGRDPNNPSMSIDVKTIFLSRNKGAIVLELQPQDWSASGLEQIASLSLAYHRPDGSAVSGGLEEQCSYAPTEDTTLHEQPGIRKAVALVNWAVGVKRGLEKRESGDHAGAKAIVQATRDAFAAEAEALNDEGLKRELELIDKLLALL